MAEPIAEAFIRFRADTSQIKPDIQLGTQEALAQIANQSRQEYAALIRSVQAAEVNGTKLIVTKEQIAFATGKMLQAEIQYQQAVFNSARSDAEATEAVRALTVAREQLAVANQAAAGSAAAANGESSLGLLGRRLERREGTAALGLLAGRLGVIGFTAAAAFQGVSKLGEALKTTGDEAFTTEGKLRNAGAALLSGDVLGAFEAMDKEAPSVVERFKALQSQSTTTAAEIRSFGQDTAAQVQKLEATAQAAEALNGPLSFTAVVARKAADEYRETAAAALNLARAMNIAEQAATDVNNALAANPGAFGAERGGAGGVAAESARSAGFANASDSTNTPENRAAIRQAHVDATKSLQDNLRLAREEEAAARQRQENDKGITEGRVQRARDVADAAAKVAAIETQIADQNKAAADRAEQERKRQAAEAERERQARLALLREERAAALQKYKDDRDFELGQIRNQEAVAALNENKERQIDLKREEIRKLQQLERDKAHYDREERQAFRAEEIRARGELKSLLGGGSAGASGFSIEDFFNIAVGDFEAFGSNIAGGWGGILSPQDARGQIAALALGKGARSPAASAGKTTSAGDPISSQLNNNAKSQQFQADSQLIELKRQTVLLQRIARGTDNLAIGIGPARSGSLAGFIPGANFATSAHTR